MKTIKIGRNPDNDIEVNDDSNIVSRYHAVLKVYDNGSITICDISTNGTYINGVKASKNIDTPVNHGDDILFGKNNRLDWSLVEIPAIAKKADATEYNNNNNYNYNKEVYTQPQEMFEKPFSFEGRIRRLEYGISNIIYAAIAIFLNYKVDNDYNLRWIYIAYIPMMWFLLAQNTKRCHELGNSGWYQLIPFYGLWLLFADGNKGSNQYGNNPKGIY